jgi:hypothetical protein
MLFMHDKLTTEACKDKGKPLSLTHQNLSLKSWSIYMKNILSHLARWLSSSQPTRATLSNGVAQKLMERAEADAGRDPHQAQELRSAACAYLSVVR